MNDINLFAETNFRNQKSKFGIKLNDRRKHLYVVGKTGMGKTTLLENMAIQDIQSGQGVGIVDPHGEFAQKMLDFVPSNRINDVIYFNPADLDNPIAFNAVEKVGPEFRHLVASGLIGVFKKLWAESWGPRLEYVLRNAILALLEYPGSTLLGVMRMLTDKGYRKKVIETINDPVVKSFWVDEFAKYPDRFMAEAVAPIQNKVGQFLTTPLIRNIVGQTKSSIDIRKVMDEKKILIMNLSKGLIGEDTSALLGAMLITRIQLAAMSRVDIPEEERKDFYLYVDEFQNFATESFANILSEARKYRLGLILAHQYITQMEEIVRDAVFGNVGTMLVFRVGAQDADYLEKEFMPEFEALDLVNLSFAQIYLKLMIDGVASRPFSANTLPPIQKQAESYRDKIIASSRERYSNRREDVEEKISKWSESIIIENKPANSGGSGGSGVSGGSNKEDVILYDAVCARCNQKIKVKFKPDGVRPVYCQECLEKVREEKTEKEEAVSAERVVQQQETETEIKTDQPPEKEISLEEAVKKPAQPISRKKERKEVDLEGLREVLNDIAPLSEKMDKIDK
ncbi:MAG: type IV secretion system DNA-binding domain-containing protein [bacterium]